MFPHDENIVTIDQLMYYDPKGLATLKHVLPTIDTTVNIVSLSYMYVVIQSLFIGIPLIDTFLSLLPPPSTTEILDFCTITSGKVLTSS